MSLFPKPLFGKSMQFLGKTIAPLVVCVLFLGSVFAQPAKFGVGSKQATKSPSPPAETGVQDDEADRPIQKTGTDKIRFSFDEQPWKPIIEFFAEEAGFSLQPIDTPPEGSFKYHDDREYTVMEALDQINGALRLRGFTLIRNNKMLVLMKDTEIPESLIETVLPEELESRGKYEILRCVYKMDGLENSTIVEQIQNFTSKERSFLYIPDAAKLYVVDTGAKLRDVRGMLAAAREKMIGSNLKFKSYDMEVTDPESLLEVARSMMMIPQGSTGLPDNSFSYAIEPLGDTIYLKGTEDKIDEFLRIAEMVDTEKGDDTGMTIVKPYLRKYTTIGDPELVFKILQTVLEGRDGVRMDQDENTGAVYVWGRDDDHAIVEANVPELSKSLDDFAQITVASDPTEMIIKLQAMLGQSDEDSVMKGPRLLADPDNDLIIVSGTPGEVARVRDMVAEFDKVGGISDGPRTNSRMIEISDFTLAEEIATMLGETSSTLGRRNRLNFVWPKDRESLRNKKRGMKALGLPPTDSLPKEYEDRGQGQDNPPANDGRLPAKSGDSPKSGSGKLSPQIPKTFSSILTLRQTSYVSAPVFQDDDNGKAGKTSDETKKSGYSQDYKPPVQLPSIPNAPVEIKVTQYGIMLTSDDLDALDDLEYWIMQRLDAETEVQLPTIFYLKHRKVDQAITILENILGIDDGGGGGGGGVAGGMIGGMMSNMMGGGAGDLLGDLLGGGGGLDSEASGIELEGVDVRISTDIGFNSLIISGATENDLDLISQMIDYIDQPGAPHSPELVGKTRVIHVEYRDPVELTDVIRKQLPDYIKPEGGASGQNNAQAQQAAQMQQMAKAMQQLTGQGGKRGKSDNPDAERPKAQLGVDEETGNILVTGPEFIYYEVLDVVRQLDLPELNLPKHVEHVPSAGKVSPELLQRALGSMFGDKVVFGDGTGTQQSGAGGAGTRNGATRSTQPGGGGAAEQMQRAMQSQLMNAMRARGGTTQRGGQQRGGGGGQRGGGGRGGR